MTPRYTLRYEPPSPADGPLGRGRWAIHRHPLDDTAPTLLATNTRIPATAVDLAHWWAIDKMREHATRVVMWQVHAEPGVYVAYTAPLRSWDITVGTDRAGHHWVRRADGWACTDGIRRRSLAQMRTCGGFARVTGVSSLTALVDEVLVYRATAGYLEGPEDCLERECASYLGPDDEDDPTVEYCEHVEHRIATAAQVYALARVEWELNRLAGEYAPPGDDEADKYSADELAARRMVLQAVEAIRDAIGRTDDDD